MKQLDLSSIATQGAHLIEASAGTGKTWTIAALYILLLLEKQLRPDEILVVTYTKSATAELRDRIRSRIASSLDLLRSSRPPHDPLEEILLSGRIPDRDNAALMLARALYAFDDAAVFTIHGFCQRALLENAFESGSLFDTDMTADQSAILAEVCDDYWRTHILTEDPIVIAYLASARITPSSLAEPFEGHYQDPYLKVIPTPSPAAVGEISTICRDSMVSAADTWSRCSDEILHELRTAGLNQRSYKNERIDAAAAALGPWLSQCDPLIELPLLKLFTTTGLQSGQKSGSTMPRHPFFASCQKLSDSLDELRQCLDDTLIRHQIELQSWIRRELAQRKQRLNLRSYDDLLLDLHQALESTSGAVLATTLRSRFRAALIDEFQDTDPLQWNIFAHLAGYHPESDQTAASTYPLFLIGDPKQAIYSFRGADIHAYIAAGRLIPDDRRATLDTNRRSVAPLVEAVNTLFQNSSDPFLTSEIDYPPVTSGRDPQHRLLYRGSDLSQPLEFWIYPRSEENRAARKPEATRAITAALAGRISAMLGGDWEIVDRQGRRPLRPGDLAVLVKAHYQADLVQEALAGLSIPAVQHGGATIFESIEALDLLRIMRAAHEPGNERLVREALLTTTLGIPADLIAGWLAAGGNDRNWEFWLVRFRALRHSAATGGIMTMVEQLLDECGVRNGCLTRTGGERSLTNLIQCAELLHVAELERGSSLASLIPWLERRIVSPDNDESALLRLESDDDAVQIATIHASKGLEYPVVFLPFAWDAPSNRHLRPLCHDGEGRLLLDLGSPEIENTKLAAQRERDAESARLLYVALTRAEFFCCVAWGCIADSSRTPLFRLLHGSSMEDPGKFKLRTDNEICADVAALGSESSGISAQMLPTDPPVPYSSPAEHAAAPRWRSFEARIPQEWRVTSFSSLTSGSEPLPQPHDHDAVRPGELLSLIAPEGDHRSIFDFPRGAAAGSCLHQIFERLDFSGLDHSHIHQVCSAALASGGYDASWLPAVCGMVHETATARLPVDNGFRLAELRPGDWDCEVEFYLPLDLLSPRRLGELFRGQLDPVRHATFEELLADLGFRQTRGMLHGFIDMIFVHDGRYYLLDWKSNHLGNDPSCYTPPRLAISMAEHLYILQHHLYTLALDRHLCQRLPGYDYTQHIGGSLYLYLRGISSQHPECGIYHDRPTEEFIRRANKEILG